MEGHLTIKGKKLQKCPPKGVKGSCSATSLLGTSLKVSALDVGTVWQTTQNYASTLHKPETHLSVFKPPGGLCLIAKPALEWH